MADHSNSIDITDPANADDSGDGAQEIRDLKNELDERLSEDHYHGDSITDTAGNKDGRHRYVTLTESASKPSTIRVAGALANTGALYTKDDGGDTEFYYEDDSANEAQLTRDGKPANGLNSGSSVYCSSGQTINALTYTKVQFNVENWDILGEYDSATNYRFTATIAGYYLVNLYIEFILDDNDGIISAIYKNGAATAINQTRCSQNTTSQGSFVSKVIYLNGSTDYIEGYARHAYSSSRTINTNCYMDISLIGV